MLDPTKSMNALDRLARHPARNWLLLVALIGWALWMVSLHPAEARAMGAAVVQSPGAPLYAMSLLVVALLAVMYRGIQQEVRESRTQHELCRAEQSAMRTAIVTLLMELPDVSKEKGRLIVNVLDRAILDARQQFVVRDFPQQPLVGGQRSTDPGAES